MATKTRKLFRRVTAFFGGAIGLTGCDDKSSRHPVLELAISDDRKSIKIQIANLNGAEYASIVVLLGGVSHQNVRVSPDDVASQYHAVVHLRDEKGRGYVGRAYAQFKIISDGSWKIESGETHDIPDGVDNKLAIIVTPRLESLEGHPKIYTISIENLSGDLKFSSDIVQ
ncbi:MAG: hypothetical protein LBI57_03570 [Helicobacteraceae bacterium]|jgi:hypothetical protein|nr:hypothetical protein [Helicobacteraceae bacterium]